ncbi:hypothetical protein BKA82DRAFT_4345605 [Pisolithus tinctorius]|nr:hypothetical protein BKA82DRAFT_4345605 [Pisolithus tinctorius]
MVRSAGAKNAALGSQHWARVTTATYPDSLGSSYLDVTAISIRFLPLRAVFHLVLYISILGLAAPGIEQVIVTIRFSRDLVLFPHPLPALGSSKGYSDSNGIADLLG